VAPSGPRSAYHLVQKWPRKDSEGETGHAYQLRPRSLAGGHKKSQGRPHGLPWAILRHGDRRDLPRWLQSYDGKKPATLQSKSHHRH
jgi:hypothetical protein